MVLLRKLILLLAVRKLRLLPDVRKRTLLPVVRKLLLLLAVRKLAALQSCRSPMSACDQAVQETLRLDYCTSGVVSCRLVR